MLSSEETENQQRDFWLIVKATKFEENLYVTIILKSENKLKCLSVARLFKIV